MMTTEKEIEDFIDRIKRENLGEEQIPGQEREQKLMLLLENVASGKVEGDALYSAIHVFGEAQYYAAEPVVERFLEHEDPNLRNIALNVLGIHWQSTKHRKVFESFLCNQEEDEDNRGMAASCLGFICWGTKDKAALRTLLRFFKDDNEDWFVRASAYDAILDVWGVPYQGRPSAAKKLDFERDVDWTLIQEIEKYVQA